MSSFFDSVERFSRTGGLSTHRNPAMKTLTLVAHEPTCQTPPAGILGLPLSARPRSIGDRQTAPLPPLPTPVPPPMPMPMLMPVSMSISNEETIPLGAMPGSVSNTTMHMTEGAKELAQQGVHATFKILLWATDPKVMSSIDRRNRVVFLLLDGKRTIRDIARLFHRNEIDIARTLVRLLKQGYIVNTEAE